MHKKLVLGCQNAQEVSSELNKNALLETPVAGTAWAVACDPSGPARSPCESLDKGSFSVCPAE